MKKEKYNENELRNGIVDNLILDHWWNDKSVELTTIDNKTYALNGWNGENYIDCWECKGNEIVGDINYTITPIYDLVDEDTEKYIITGFQIL